MTPGSCFEDLRCWQQARRVAALALRHAQRDPLSSHYFLRDQISRAAVSIMANIAEGFGRYTNPDFRRFLRYAHGSCTELQSLLHAATDQRLLDAETGAALREEAEKVRRCISALYVSLAPRKARRNRTS